MPGLSAAALETFRFVHSPGSVVGFARSRPGYWWWPCLVVVCGSALFWGWYFHSVDAAWLVAEANLHLAGTGLRDPRISRRLLAPGMLFAQTLMGTVASLGLSVCLIAAYLRSAARLSGSGDSRFLQWLSLSSWAMLPRVASLAGRALRFGMSAVQDVDPDDLAVTAIGPLLGMHPDGALGVLAGIDVTTLWTIALLALGFGRQCRASWPRSLFIAALPWFALVSLRMLLATG